MRHGQHALFSLSRKRGLLVILGGFRLVLWRREMMPSMFDHRPVTALAPAVSVDLGRVGVKVRFGEGLLDGGPEYPTSTLTPVRLGPVEILLRKGPRMLGCAR
ncbi:MAG TPA: hypothetical protein VFM87_08670 [Agrococcus sp.]|nr:hypothetical protein [Agrococcus sp.]